MTFLASILIPAFIILIAVLLLGFKVFFTKKGNFPNIHIGGNKHLKDKGVSCATSQDADAQKSYKRIDINKLLKETEL